MTTEESPKGVTVHLADGVQIFLPPGSCLRRAEVHYKSGASMLSEEFTTTTYYNPEGM